MSQTQRPTMPETPPSPSIWARSRMKLQFFARVRRFLQAKTTQRNAKSRNKVVVSKEEQVATADKQSCGGGGGGGGDDLVVLQRSVKRLHFGGMEEKEMAAVEIERLAREDVKMRKLMAELGVIPALVGMAASEVAGRRRVAIKALIELADGTYT
ncbi:hypothetical protein OIU77_009314 [Salix suchowensis]|uniref:Uncharacterized protein n=1 Tax=Salix suchowensis TaxID=1278906 RepID=A0ABQ9ADW2_9ROSI|nr:hypothetical protein OIU77_009314 [Salix suchowensis]